MNFSESESQRFGLNIFRATYEEVDPRLIASDLFSKMVDVAIVRIPTGQSNRIWELRRWILPVSQADTLVYYQCDLSKYESHDLRNKDLVFAEATKEDMKEVEALISHTFSGYVSHYSSNPLFNPQLTLEGYKEWALGHACQSDTDLWLARRDGKIVAFAACKLNADDEYEGVLYGVAPEASGGGLYGDLIRFTQSWAKLKGCKRMLVSTQVNNFAVQKVWSREGFHLFKAYDTFHVSPLMNAHKVISDRPVTFSQSQISAYAELSGDNNPIHRDKEAAYAAGFNGCITHGVLALSEFSKILGTEIPGTGTVILQLESAFLKPILADTQYFLSMNLIPSTSKLKIAVLTIANELGEICMTARSQIL